MNQQKLQAYLNLIQKLLDCPRGEEWILLRQNEQLVNPELVEIMEQVAGHLANESHLEEAKFLHNLAGQLHHILTTPIAPKNQEQQQAYLQLIQSLLDHPKSQWKQILANHSELVDPGFIQTLKIIVNQAISQNDIETANDLNELAQNLTQEWLKKHQFPTPSKPAKESLKTPEQPEKTQITSPENSPINQLNQEILLNTISKSLTKIETILSEHLKPVDPLWYLEKLEKAQEYNWLLTTQEVEQLIGVKPECKRGKNTYQRGNWLFIKAGKIGNQTAWQVLKKTLQKEAFEQPKVSRVDEVKSDDPWVK